MKKPTIGITSDFTDGYNDNYPSLLTYRLKSSYIKAVINAGGVPLIIPFDESIDPIDVISKIDGLIISGSKDDIDKYFLSQSNRPNRSNSFKRQQFEFSLASHAIDRGIPVLGICGGMQLINVLFGGNLIEDIPSQTGSKIHKKKYFEIAHKILIKKDSHLYRAAGVEELEVNSTHHQAVYDIPNHFVGTAIAEDGIVEAIEYKSNQFVVGVQYHPEALIKDKNHLKLFEYFIKKARRR